MTKNTNRVIWVKSTLVTKCYRKFWDISCLLKIMPWSLNKKRSQTCQLWAIYLNVPGYLNCFLTLFSIHILFSLQCRAQWDNSAQNLNLKRHISSNFLILWDGQRKRSQRIACLRDLHFLAHMKQWENLKI